MFRKNLILTPKDLDRLLNGKYTRITPAQIQMSIVSLVDANYFLKPDKYAVFKEKFDYFAKYYREKEQMNMNTYLYWCKQIIDNYEEIIPFELVCGDPSFHADGMSKWKEWDAAVESIAQSRARCSRYAIELLRREENGKDLSYLIKSLPLYYSTIDKYWIEAKRAANKYGGNLKYISDNSNLRLTEYLLGKYLNITKESIDEYELKSIYYNRVIVPSKCNAGTPKFDPKLLLNGLLKYSLDFDNYKYSDSVINQVSQFLSRGNNELGQYNGSSGELIRRIANLH